MKRYIWLINDERFNIDYNKIIGIEYYRELKVGDKFAKKVKLYETADKKTRQWVVLQVVKVDFMFICVKVVKANV